MALTGRRRGIHRAAIGVLVLLESVAFKEGQQVRKGQVIARIDSRALEAQLAVAQGTLAHDQAMPGNVRADGGWQWVGTKQTR